MPIGDGLGAVFVNVAVQTEFESFLPQPAQKSIRLDLPGASDRMVPDGDAEYRIVFFDQSFLNGFHYLSLRLRQSSVSGRGVTHHA